MYEKDGAPGGRSFPIAEEAEEVGWRRLTVVSAQSSIEKMREGGYRKVVCTENFQCSWPCPSSIPW